jgi:hypothetical protein
MPYIVGILPRPIYTFQSDVHVRPRHIENTDPRFRTKTKFKPGEGGQAFDDEIYQHRMLLRTSNSMTKGMFMKWMI